MCSLEGACKEFVGTIVAFEMWRGSVMLPERFHFREAGTAEVALEVVICVFVMLASFSRPKAAGTIVAPEPRMLRLLVCEAAMLCAEFAVTVATLDLGSVLGFPVLGESVVE